jgi:hypothetical protein
LARPYVKTVRSKGKVYFYLVEPRIVGGRTIGQKMLRKLSQEEARSYGWKRDPNGQNHTVGLEEQEGVEERVRSHGWKERIDPKEPGSKEPTDANNSPEPEFHTGTERCETRPVETLQDEGATGQAEVAREPEKEEFKVVPRPRGFYALEPLGPNTPKGYAMVRTDLDGVTNVFCGLCPGFTCSHVEFMHKWLRTHRGYSE